MNKTIAFFDELAPIWDQLCVHDPDKIEKILMQVGEIKDKSILDVGCGTGILEKYLLPKKPKRIVGVDVSSKMIEIAKQKFPTVEYMNADIMKLTNQSFDLIILYSVLPHFKDLTMLMAHLKNLLNPGGVIAIAHSESKEVINRHHDEHAKGVSKSLIDANAFAAQYHQWYEPLHLVDNDEMYLVVLKSIERFCKPKRRIKMSRKLLSKGYGEIDINPTIELKVISENHLCDLAPVLYEAYLNTEDGEGVTLKLAEDEIPLVMNGEYGQFLGEASFILYHEDECIGGILITLLNETPLIAYVFIKPTHKGMGLGTLLISNSIRKLSELGYENLNLFVLPTNKAIQLYEKLCFEKSI